MQGGCYAFLQERAPLPLRTHRLSAVSPVYHKLRLHNVINFHYYYVKR